MADLSELDAKMEACGAVIRAVEGEFDDTEDDQIQVDMHDAMVLLKRGTNLLNFLGDRDLCKALSVRERETINRLSVQFTEFLSEAESSYGEA